MTKFRVKFKAGFTAITGLQHLMVSSINKAMVMDYLNNIMLIDDTEVESIEEEKIVDTKFKQLVMGLRMENDLTEEEKERMFEELQDQMIQFIEDHFAVTVDACFMSDDSVE